MKPRPFWVLVRKELREQAKSHRLLILGLVFVFFGLASPLFAKFAPEILKSVGTGQGITIALPEPTAADAVVQFVKNLSQIALFVLVFLTMGSVVAEKERSTAAFVLVKPASRRAFLAAKVTALWTTTIAAVALSALCTYGYTTVLFGPPAGAGFVLATATLLFHILTFVTTTFLCSVLSRSQVVAGVVSFLVWVLLASLGGLGRASEFLPGRLVTAAVEAFQGASLPWEPVAGSGAIVLISLALAFVAFRRWEP